LIAGIQDRLAPPGAWKHELPKPARVTIHPGGHIPFWECPELVDGALHRLAGIETSR
jgi:pimeloyl-ACP methyl ester carboxylesterase